MFARKNDQQPENRLRLSTVKVRVYRSMEPPTKLGIPTRNNAMVNLQKLEGLTKLAQPASGFLRKKLPKVATFLRFVSVKLPEHQVLLSPNLSQYRSKGACFMKPFKIGTPNTILISFNEHPSYPWPEAARQGGGPHRIDNHLKFLASFWQPQNPNFMTKQMTQPRCQVGIQVFAGVGREDFCD